MKARAKAKEVEFIRHTGPLTLSVVGKKGEQRAQPGDVILITGDTPLDREVISAKDFADSYEALDDNGNVIEGKSDKPEPGTALGYPHFDTVEQAQAAAQAHYAPEATVEGDSSTKRPASTEPFFCTIGATDHTYSVQPSGMIAQVANVMQDSAADPGFGTPAGSQMDKYPATLANQGQSVHEGVDGEDVPVSSFQKGSASEETPASTFGTADNQPLNEKTNPDESWAGDIQPVADNPRPEGEGSAHEEK